MTRVDIHQHLWPERLIDELSRRDRPPSIRKSGARWKLRLNGEPDHLFDLSDTTRTFAHGSSAGKESIGR